MVATIQAYVTLRSWGMEDFSTKKTVLVPVGMQVLTPWVRRPKLLVRDLTQVLPMGPCMRCQLFKRLTDGWVDDDVGLFLLLEKVAESGNITRLGAAFPTVVGRWTVPGRR